MTPDINRNDADLCPSRVFPRMPRLMEPIPQAPAREQPAPNRNRNQNQPAAQNNQQRDEANRRRLPFFFRLFIGPHIARYLRMRRAMNEARRQNVVGQGRPETSADRANSNSGQSSSEPSTSQQN